MADAKHHGKSGYADKIADVSDQIHPGYIIKIPAIRYIDNFLYKIGVMLNDAYVVEKRENSEPSLPAIFKVIENIFPGELGKYASAEAKRVITKGKSVLDSYENFTPEELSNKLGLKFPPDRIEGKYGEITDKIYSRTVVATVMEYFTSEILEISGNKARERESKSEDISSDFDFDPDVSDEEEPIEITESDIRIAIAKDEDLSKIKFKKPSTTKKPARVKTPPKPTKTQGKDYDKMTAVQLYKEAQILKIPGRSNIRKEGKAALLAAVKKASKS
jgi:hypothetical protein